MKITGKAVFFNVAILSTIAFISLLIWKFCFNGYIPTVSLLVIGIAEIAILVVCIVTRNKH